VTNDLAVFSAIHLLNLSFDQGYKKADKGQEKEGFFHEEELFVGERGFPGVFDEVNKDFLGLFNFWGFLIFIFDVGDFFISEIDSLPVNIVMVPFEIQFILWLVITSANGFEHNGDSFTHFFFFSFFIISKLTYF
jgi:hypothetical protein